MGPRECNVCNRRFTKTEHLRRHERSHTKEKPYECYICHKLFSRSDVLCRHIKGHAQQSQKAASTDPATESELRAHPDRGRAEPSGQLVNKVIFVSGPHQGSSANPLRTSPQNPHHEQETTTPQTQHTPNFESGIAEGQDSESRLDQNTPTTHSHLGPSPAGENRMPTMDIIMEDPRPGNIAPPQPLPWTPRDSDHLSNGHSLNQNSMGDQRGHGLPSYDSGIEMLSFAASDTAFDTAAWTLENGRPSPGFPGLQVPDGNINGESVAEMLQTWLFQPNNGTLPQVRTRDAVTPRYPDRHSNHHLSAQSPDSAMENAGRPRSAFRIPLDRFKRVQKCWHPESAKSNLLMPNLWESLVNCTRDNLVCMINPAVDFECRTGRRWKFDEGSRARLQRAICGGPRDPSFHSLQTPDSPANSVTSSGCSAHPDDVILPPVEIFEAALDVYFGQFHPTLPIIHHATFVPENVPASLLLAMTLLGFSILGTTGATRFVSQTFSRILELATQELNTSTAKRTEPAELLTTMVTTLLTLNLAAVSGNKRRLGQTEMLYVNLISTAQWHGILSAAEGVSPEEVLSKIEHTEAQWKAWAKIESTKRFIVGLVEIDAWFATYLSKRPIIRSENVRILPPSSDELFEATSASIWSQLVRDGGILEIPAMSPSEIPGSAARFGRPCLRGLLTLLKLRIYDANYRLSSRNQFDWSRSLEPWRVLLEDPRDRALASLTVGLVSADVDAFRNADVNSAVLWHSCCLMLSANTQLLEAAIGRSGPDQAVLALDEIAKWSQTPTARRACLHAGEIYRILFNRKVNDAVNMYTAAALFQSAVVLGLYLSTAGTQEQVDNDHPVELLGGFDWTSIGNVGLDNDSGHENLISSILDYGDHSQHSINFIRHGGAVSVAKYLHPPGYASARRVLIHFADLMEGMGKWKSRTFSEILHIISDDLMDVGQEDGEADE